MSRCDTCPRNRGTMRMANRDYVSCFNRVKGCLTYVPYPNDCEGVVTPNERKDYESKEKRRRSYMDIKYGSQAPDDDVLYKPRFPRRQK